MYQVAGYLMKGITLLISPLLAQGRSIVYINQCLFQSCKGLNPMLTKETSESKSDQQAVKTTVRSLT